MEHGSVTYKYVPKVVGAGNQYSSLDGGGEVTLPINKGETPEKALDRAMKIVVGHWEKNIDALLEPVEETVRGFKGRG